MFDLDMNRIFPGSRHGSMAEQIAAGVIEDLSGADLCIDIHASDIYLREVAQVRISEDTAQQLLPLGQTAECRFRVDPCLGDGAGGHAGPQPEYDRNTDAGSGDGGRHADHQTIHGTAGDPGFSGSCRKWASGTDRQNRCGRR